MNSMAMKNLAVKRLAGATIAAAVACTLISGDAFSQTVVGYELFMVPGDQATQPATIVAAGVDGLDVIRGGGLGPNAGGNSFNSKGWATNAVGLPTVVNT